MIRRLAGVALVACAFFALGTAGAAAEIPAGPRLTFVKTRRSADLVSSDPSGQDQRVIAPGTSSFTASAFDPLAWSPDGSHVVFGGVTPAKHGAVENLYLAAADGSELVQLPHTAEALYPTYSPDGRTIAFARLRQRDTYRRHRGKVTRFTGAATFELDVESGTVHQISPWRNRLFVYPTDFSPDGQTLLLTWERSTHRRRFRDQVVAMALDGSERTVVADSAGDATYSPDGSRLALIALGRLHTLHRDTGRITYRETELAVANADGSGLTILTHTRALASAPGWDPSGQRLVYTQFPVPRGESTFLGVGDSIMEINPDGSCRTKVLSEPGVILFGATWQPGPGREAGPISC